MTNINNGITSILDGSEKLTLSYSGMTDTGKIREVNEDTFIIIPENNVFAVADGVGGMSAGDVASQMLASGVRKKLKRPFSFLPMCLMRFFERKDYNDHIEEVIKQRNIDIYNKSRDLKRPMASTIVLAQFSGLKVKMIHVGDSRGYLFRNQEITQITKDHSLVYELYQQGQLTYDAMRTHPRRNVITRAVGAKRNVVPETTTHTIKAGDCILLCSDGLTSMLTDDEITDIMRNEELFIYDTVKLLVKKANDAGGKDNITVIIIKIQ